MKETRQPQKKLFWIAIMLLPLLALACRTLVGDTPQTRNAPEAEAPIVITQIAPNITQATPDLTYLPEAVADEQQLLITLYARVNPAVVNIVNYSSQGNQIIGMGQGSGFLYDNEGHIITNAHVVHSSSQLEVTFWNGMVRDAELLGEDLNSDIAVIRVEEVPEGVEPLPLGDINQVVVGQTVVAIGNPFGLEGTLTRGIVSAIGRTIPALTQFSIPMAIQTDAAINPGNSGGPLLNLKGEVIGINAQIETSGLQGTNSGVGFAVPVNIVQQVVPGLIEEGNYEWSYMGVRGYTLTRAQAQAMDLPVEQGAYISEITNDGPAEKAGMRGSRDTDVHNGRTVEVGGDVVTAIDGQPVTTFDDLLVYVALQTRPGQEITVSILRDGEPMEIELTVEARPETVESQQPEIPTLP
jgi:S1-C subfamily serine protease